MKHRLFGALRDMWWMLGFFLAASVAIGIFADPVVAAVLGLAIIATFVYFAWVRYDDAGRERDDLDRSPRR